MKLLLSEKLAARALLFIIAATLIFHGLVITGVVPYSIVWGSRIKDQSQMLAFEAVSILINGLLLGVVAVRADVLRVGLPSRLIQAVLWLMVGLFALNTVGNLLSENEFEKMVFTPVTLLLALLSLRLALGRPRQTSWV